MANRYRIPTTLCGTVRDDKYGGRYGTKTFSYRITDEQHDQIHGDRWELIQFAKSQTKAKRPQEIPPPWDEGLVIKYRWDEAVPDKRPEFVDAAGMPLAQEVLESLKAGTKVTLTIDQKPFVLGHKPGRTTHARVGTILRVVKVEVTNASEGKKRGRRQPVATPIDRSTPDNPMQRTLSDLVGSAVVFDLQQLLETYLPVVGNEGRNELIATIRREANEYLDQEQI